MAIRKFEVTAIRTDEYIIEIDDEIFNEEWLKAFSRVFFEVDDLKDIVRNLAFHQLRFGSARFVEGYGNVLRNGRLPFSGRDFDGQGNWLPEDQRDKPALGINIELKNEDDDYDYEILEVTDGEA